MSKDQALEAFLAELNGLSRKHGIYISGCGCCGSPFLYRGDDATDHENPPARNFLAYRLGWKDVRYTVEE